MEIIVLSRDCRLCDAAKKYCVEERTLMALNGLEGHGTLPEGMSLVLPRGKNRPGGAAELYYTRNGKAAREAPGASFLAGEFEPWEEMTLEMFPDYAEGCAALPVYCVTGRGDLARLRPLICERERSAAYLDTLTASLAEQGFGALGLNISRVLPFDRACFTDFARQAAEAAHKRGLWFICTLPLYIERERHQRPFAAYDGAALGEAADRLILDSGSLTAAEDMAAGLEYACTLVPGGRLLLGVREGARLLRGEGRERIYAHTAQNMAAAATARISRRSKGGLAEFSYTDPAGAHCRVEYGDALWAGEVCALVGKYSLAGLARHRGYGCTGAAERVFEAYFSARETL